MPWTLTSTLIAPASLFHVLFKLPFCAKIRLKMGSIATLVRFVDLFLRRDLTFLRFPRIIFLAVIVCIWTFVITDDCCSGLGCWLWFYSSFDIWICRQISLGVSFNIWDAAWRIRFFSRAIVICNLCINFSLCGYCLIFLLLTVLYKFFWDNVFFISETANKNNMSARPVVKTTFMRWAILALYNVNILILCYF